MSGLLLAVGPSSVVIVSFVVVDCCWSTVAGKTPSCATIVVDGWGLLLEVARGGKSCESLTTGGACDGDGNDCRSDDWVQCVDGGIRRCWFKTRCEVEVVVALPEGKKGSTVVWTGGEYWLAHSTKPSYKKSKGVCTAV